MKNPKVGELVRVFGIPINKRDRHFCGERFEIIFVDELAGTVTVTHPERVAVVTFEFYRHQCVRLKQKKRKEFWVGYYPPEKPDQFRCFPKERYGDNIGLGVTVGVTGYGGWEWILTREVRNGKSKREERNDPIGPESRREDGRRFS